MTKNKALWRGTGGLASQSSYFGLNLDICNKTLGGWLFDSDSSKKPYACVRKTANSSGIAYSGVNGPLMTTRESVSLNGLWGVPVGTSSDSPGRKSFFSPLTRRLNVPSVTIKFSGKEV